MRVCVCVCVPPPTQTQLDLDPRVEEVLLHESLSSPSEIRDCELAAASLQSSLQQELPSGVDVLQAVTEQTEAFHNLSAAFGRRLYTHLSGLFTLNVSVVLVLLTCSMPSSLCPYRRP